MMYREKLCHLRLVADAGERVVLKKKKKKKMYSQTTYMKLAAF